MEGAMAEKQKLAERVASETGLGALRPGTMQFVLEEGVKAESVHAMLDRAFEMHGCRPCGMAGLDLGIRIRDKLIFERFRDIEGVLDVAVTRY
jgi:hypothetical protein